MKWVGPIKDKEKLKDFKNLLRRTNDKYYIMFEIGVGTGLSVNDILALKVKDVRDKDYIIARIGIKKILHEFKISPALKEIIHDYTNGKSPESYLIGGYNNSRKPLSREQAYRTLNNAGKAVGLKDVGAQTMRKTFAWNYYKATGDIFYIQNLLSHASPTITYRYLGEEPNIKVSLRKLTPKENERSRYMLNNDNNGKKRIRKIKEVIENLENEMDNPMNNDAFYGRVECLIVEVEEHLKNFNILQEDVPGGIH